MNTCDYCRRQPAAPVVFRLFATIILPAVVTTTRGCYCYDCGLSVYRSTMSRMLFGGWLGLPAVIGVPMVWLMNMSELRTLKHLRAPHVSPPAPQSGQARFSVGSHGDASEITPPPSSSAGRPLDAGAPLWRRPSSYTMPAVLLAAILLLIFL